MCKKLIVLLLVVGLSVPAMADYIGFGNPLKVDLTLEGDAQNPKGTWQDWETPWSWTSPITKTFSNPLAFDPWEVPVGQLESYRMTQTAQGGGSRNRSGGMAFVAGTGDFQFTGNGFGTNYLKLTVTGLAPDTAYKVVVWSFEKTNVWAVNSNNPNSKFAVWSTVNPLDWLTNNGYPTGYGPEYSIDNPVPTTDSNMPCDLKNLALANGKRFSIMAPTDDDYNYVSFQDRYCAKICEVMTSSSGALALYGWIDATDWSGSMHLPINGFIIVPEPMTIALLGLGGLALIRRKRA